jgi:hypothetical protein
MDWSTMDWSMDWLGLASFADRFNTAYDQPSTANQQTSTGTGFWNTPFPYYDGVSPTTYGTMTPTQVAIGSVVAVTVPFAAASGASLLAGAGGETLVGAGAGPTIFAGHGIESALAGTMVVPEGAAITLPASGAVIPNSLGLAIEAGDWAAIAQNARGIG